MHREIGVFHTYPEEKMKREIRLITMYTSSSTYLISFSSDANDEEKNLFLIQITPR